MKNILVVAIILTLGLIIFLFYKGVEFSPDNDKNEITSVNDSILVTDVDTNEPPRLTNIILASPKEITVGKKKGVIVLGAAGFDAFTIRINEDKEWSMLKEDFGVSLLSAGNNLVSISSVEKQMREYINDMIDLGVRGKDIHFIMSSGAAQQEDGKKIEIGIKNLGYVVTTVSSSEEATYGFKATIQDEYRNETLFVDIGSGNTKIAWYENEEINTLETYGSRYYQNNIRDSDVSNRIKELMQQVPKDKVKKCFLIGGAPFKLARLSKKDGEKYTILKEFSDYNIKDDERAKSAIVICQAIKESTGCETFIFTWKTNFSIGFLMTIPY